MSARYAVAVHRIKESERSQDPSDQLSWAGNEMGSIIRDGDPVLIDLPVAWAGLAMVHKAQHEISASFETKQNELLEMEDRAVNSLKQVFSGFPEPLSDKSVAFVCICYVSSLLELVNDARWGEPPHVVYCSTYFTYSSMLTLICFDIIKQLPDSIFHFSRTYVDV